MKNQNTTRYAKDIQAAIALVNLKNQMFKAVHEAQHTLNALHHVDKWNLANGSTSKKARAILDQFTEQYTRLIETQPNVSKNWTPAAYDLQKYNSIGGFSFTLLHGLKYPENVSQNTYGVSLDNRFTIYFDFVDGKAVCTQSPTPIDETLIFEQVDEVFNKLDTFKASLKKLPADVYYHLNTAITKHRI
ncbi:hypothetical protein RZS08_32315 [Arthrospira platensis SPKY1]|nr:hypothetical protein [Arthrospira platensis SPKY1]